MPLQRGRDADFSFDVEGRVEDSKVGFSGPAQEENSSSSLAFVTGLFVGFLFEMGHRFWPGVASNS